MLSPKRTTYRNVMRGTNKGRTKRGGTIAFGEYGLQALEAVWLSNRQIEAARVAMTRKMKRGGKVWIRIFPDRPYTRKPNETRMGKGKGSLEGWVAVVKPGRMLFEIAGIERELAVEALSVAAQKLPIKVKIVEAEQL